MLQFILVMSFDDPIAVLYREFQEKYSLSPGFQGDFDLRPLFGDLVDEPCFVRDRVSIQQSLTDLFWSIFDHIILNRL